MKLISRFQVFKLNLSLLMLLLALTMSIVSFAQPSTDINTYVLFANKELHFKGRDCSTCDYGIIKGGNVGVNMCAPVNGNNLTFGGPVIMPVDGEYVVGDRVRIDYEGGANPTSIWRLYANETTVGFNVAALRNPPVLPWAPCPLLDWSAVPFPSFSAGVIDVTVNEDGSLVLPPGNYEDVWVKDNGTLYLSAGIYNVKSFKVGKHANVFTEDGIEVRSETFMTFNNDCFVGPSNAVKFFVRSDGLHPENDNSVQFSKNTEFHGLVFAPNGQLNLGHTTKLFGKFWANTIQSDWNDNVTGPDECLPSAIGGSRCKPGTIDFFAFGCPGCTDLKWYDEAVGGSVVNTGGTYSPFLNKTTSFWVTCTTAGGVESERIEVTGFVDNEQSLALSINKVVNQICAEGQGPSLPSEWHFTSDIPGYAAFTIPAEGGSVEISGIPPGTYTITEVPVNGWQPSIGNLDCDFASSSAPNSVTYTFDPTDCGEVFCSAFFNNTPASCEFPNCEITGEDTICEGGSTELCATDGMDHYSWSTGAETKCITVSTGGKYTVTITDANGITSECELDVVVNPLPVCSVTGNSTVCPSTSNTYHAPKGMDSYSWTVSGNATADGVDNDSLFSVTAGVGCNTQFTVEVTITKNGCSATCHKDVSVNDATKPVITCPIDRNLSCGQSSDTAYTGKATATDNCGNPTITYRDVPVSAGCAGVAGIDRWWKATDACGNKDSCLQSIRYVDTTIPTIQCPSNKTLDCYVPSVTFDTPSAQDNCDPNPSIIIVSTNTVTNANGSKTYTRVWKAKDACNNYSGTCSQAITVPALLTVTCTPNNMAQTLTANPSGGTTPYSYSWNTNPAQLTKTANITSTGTFTVVVTDAKGCTATTSCNVNVCNGFRTQTMGGWGTKCSGGNPGCYRDAKFAQAFPSPNYLTIGCTNKLRLTSSAAIMKVMPASGTPALLPAGTMVDPKKYDNTFAAQLIAATLSVQFDLIDPNFSSSATHLEDLIVNSGTFTGWTVKQVIAEANRLIGGCGSIYTPSQLTSVLDGINSNYIDGTKNGGFLNCPAQNRMANATEMNDGNIFSKAYPNPFNTTATIEFSTVDATSNTLVEVYSVSGEKVATIFNEATEAGMTYYAQFNAESLADGIYVYRIVYGEHLINGKLILMR